MRVIQQRLPKQAIHVYNEANLSGAEYPSVLNAALSEEGATRAAGEICAWPNHARTPLVALPALAQAVGLSELYYKDEGGRFGLGSFKALGGAYAVARALARFIQLETGEVVDSSALIAGRHRDVAARFTVTCATDGNHGRSVAWGAQLFGCECVIYVHQTVSQGRIDAVAAYGAQVITHSGNYDDTVRRAATDADANGWTVVSDTSWEGYTEIPKDVMHGYCLMCVEAISQLPAPPTHVIVPGGVGGVAAAVCAALWWHYGAQRPRLIVTEPSNAACLMESAAAGERSALDGDIETVMAGLSCGEPSKIAWQVLSVGAADFLVVDDDMAVAAMRTLAYPAGNDAAIVAGESAACVVAALQRAHANPQLTNALGLGDRARVLVFGTEGDTDPELYTQLVGSSGADIRARANARC
jgi:diaminopropionate ammonia-lyase